MNLSVCIITKNEKENLEKCLQALAGYDLEIVVADTGSTDGTLEMIRNYTGSVYEFTWCDDFAKARNFAISKAVNDRILVLDSDEYVQKMDIKQIQSCFEQFPEGIGKIRIKNYFYQKNEIQEEVEYINRLFDRRYYQYEGKIHEQLVRKDGESIQTYQAPVLINHSGYLLTKEEKWAKAERNISLLKQTLEENGEDPYILYQLGKSYYMAEDYKMASDYFSKALWYDLDPNLEYVITMVETYGYALLNSGQQEQALGLTGLEEEFGGKSDFQFLLGLVYMNNEYFEQAVNSFLKAVSLHNGRVVGVDSYLAYYNIGVIYECLSRMDRATEFYVQAGGYLPAVKRLGLYYEAKNSTQAYLFYRQQAYKSDGKAKEELEALAESVKEKMSVVVNKTAIVILSYNTLNETRNCIESIRRHCDSGTYELIVIDNASSDGSVEWLKKQNDIKLCCNKENVGFPKGCNQGIAMAEADSDIWLLNSDTLVPPDALFWLQMGLYESSDVGAAGSVTNFAPNYQNIDDTTVTDRNYLSYAMRHKISVSNPYEKKIWLVGFSVLLKRKALEQVGLLDERFSPGNYEDTDLGMRLANTGWQQLLCRNSFIFHYGSKSFGKRKPEFSKLLETNQKKFIEKWNMHPSRFSYIKVWEAEQVKRPEKETFRLLDIGCGTGATLARIINRYPDAKVTGVEKQKKAAGLAAKIADVLQSDICDIKEDAYTDCFDQILTGGIWEHIPKEQLSAVFRKLRRWAGKDCMITGSIYNREHPWCHLLPKEYKNQDIGIADADHVTGYTAEEWIDLLNAAGIRVEEFSFAKESRAEGVTEPYQYFWRGRFAQKGSLS